MSDHEDFDFLDNHPGGGMDNMSEGEEEFDIIDNSIFKSAPTKTVQISDKVDFASDGVEEEEETDIQMPMSLEDHQHQNRDIVNSQVVFLHPRGLLLVGSVLSATFEPDEEATKTSGASSILFKVLFVEGGSQSAMFRCKTPVYTSNAVKTYNHEPKWKENTFRFDMIMPEEGKGFNIYGEVLISVYRARPTGGNDLIGQVTFDLSKISKTGTVEYFQDGIQGRSLSGKYSLLMGNKVVGDIEIQLNIAWKTRPSDTEPDTMEEQLQPKRGGDPALLKTATKSKSSTAQTKAAATTTTTTRPKSAGATTGAGGVTKFIVQPQRKIVSKLAKKQKEDALRIERENKFLASKIQRHRGNNELAYNTNDAKSVIAQLQYGLTNEQAYTAEAKETTRIIQEKQKKPTIQPADSKGVGMNNDESVNRLYQIFTQIKKDIAIEDDEIKALKGKLNNLNIHIKKYSANIQRLKQKPLTTPTISGSASVGPASTNRKLMEVDSSNQGTSTPLISSSSSRRSPSPSAIDATAQPKRTTNSTEAKSNVPEVILIENNYPLTDAADGEYKSIKEEYDVLQRIRRALIERIHNAKKKCGNVDVQTNYIESKRNLLKQRLVQMVDEFGPFYAADELKSEAKSVSFDVSPTSTDFMLYAKHRSLQDELTLLEVTTMENPEYIQILSAREELKSVIKVLKERKRSIQDRLEELKIKKAELMKGLKNKLEDSSQFKIRQQITTMLGMERKIQSQERQDIIISGTKECDIQLLRLKYRAKEREKNGMYPELVNTSS